MREERKAIVTVSEGWLLFRPNAGLTTLRKDPVTGNTEPIPGPDPISVGPDGRITTKPRNTVGNVMEKSRVRRRAAVSLAHRRRELFPRHHRRSEPRATRRSTRSIRAGCPVFDTPIGPAPPPDIVTDAAMLRSASRFAANARRRHRRHGGIEQQRSGCRTQAHRQRSLFVLSAWLLLDQRQARWQVPHDQGPREAAGNRRAGAQGLSRGDRGRSRRGKKGRQPAGHFCDSCGRHGDVGVVAASAGLAFQHECRSDDRGWDRRQISTIWIAGEVPDWRSRPCLGQWREPSHWM